MLVINNIERSSNCLMLNTGIQLYLVRLEVDPNIVRKDYAGVKEDFVKFLALA